MHDDMINDVLHSQKSQRESEEAKGKKQVAKKIIQKRKLANFTNSPVAHSTE